MILLYANHRLVNIMSGPNLVETNHPGRRQVMSDFGLGLRDDGSFDPA
jgi:hypothetical protein